MTIDTKELTKLLTNEELKELTGLAYKQPQIEWLKANNIKHLVGADGRARVYRAHAMQTEVPPLTVQGDLPV